MSIADILAGKGMSENYWGNVGGQKKPKAPTPPDDDNPFDEFGLPK